MLTTSSLTAAVPSKLLLEMLTLVPFWLADEDPRPPAGFLLPAVCLLFADDHDDHLAGWQEQVVGGVGGCFKQQDDE